MKTLIATLLLAAAATGYAQQYTTTTASLTDSAAAFTTNQAVNAAAVTLTKYEDVNIEVRCKLDAAGTTSSTFKFAKSLDGVTYETVPSYTLTFANAGTTTVVGQTQVNVGAAGFLRLATITNGDDDGVLTNIVVRYTVKPARFGK